MAWKELDRDLTVKVTILATDDSGPDVSFRTSIEFPPNFTPHDIGTLLMYAATQLLEGERE